MGLRNHYGKWQVRFQRAGVEVKHNTGLAATNSNRNAAQKIEAELRLAQRLGKRLVQPKPFNEAVALYLDWAREEMKHSTWLAHRVSLTAWEVFVSTVLDGRAVGEIHGGDVETFKVWRRASKIAPNTLHNNLCVASKFFRYCRKQGWVEANPLAEIDRPGKTNVREFRVLSDVDETAYLNVARDRFPALHDLAIMMLDTGMRPEEVLRMRAEDVDLVERTVTVTQGKTAAARRRLWLSDRAHGVLEARLARQVQGWLWPSPRYEGQPMCKVNNPHEKVLTAINGDWVIYDFRHTFATRCAESGMDLATLAALLGHGSLRVVMKYVHPTPAHQVTAMRKAIEGRTAGAPLRPTLPGEFGQISPPLRQDSAQTSTGGRE